MIAPSDEDVRNVIGILGLEESDRAVIAAALQAKNNNVGQVVNEYFDSPSKFNQQYAWDENVFSADRDGSTDNQTPSFSVYPPDSNQVIQGVDPSYFGGAGAPSRPPSRTNNRSPLRAALPTSSEQEDADLQRAIAASVATSGIQSPQPLPQESGIIQADTSLPYFGPATRSGYEQGQWAMVPLNRVSPEPGPSHRMRSPGAPAFLRHRADPSFQTHRVGALLTILHAIPLARNILLRSGEPAQNYGHKSDWWKGNPILRPDVQAAQDAGELTWAEEAKPSWSEELHRLMAFLDATERSYGTADMLTKTAPEGLLPSDHLLSSDNRDSRENDFFDLLRNETGNAEKISQLMSTAEIFQIASDGQTQTNSWSLLDPTFSYEQLMMVNNLYGIWDMVFFIEPDYATELDSVRMAMITQPAEVMSMRLHCSSGGFPNRITVPEVFYIDRYLVENKERMTQIQRDMFTVSRGLVRAQKIEESISKFIDPETGTAADRAALCNAAISKIKGRMWQLKATARWRQHEEARENSDDPHFFPMSAEEDFDTGVEYTQEESKLKRIFEAEIKFYQRKLVDMERKLLKIRTQKTACEEVLSSLSTLCTVPSDEQKWYPTHSYTLRGVANTHDVCYVCVRAEPDLMEVEGAEGSSATRDQWWKLAYIAGDEEPVKAEMTTYEIAVEDACGVGSNPILVYATDKAMEEDWDPLSSALQTFVRFDNRLFKQEVKEENPLAKKRSGFSSPISPAKRRNRSSSLDSISTNRASAGDSEDDDMRDAPFEVDDPFARGDRALEMQELVDISLPAGESSDTKNHYVSALNLDDLGFESPPRRRTGPASNSSLDDMGAADESPPALPLRPRVSNEEHEQEAKAPEMQERAGASRFLTIPANGKAVGGESNAMSMELDEDLEGP